MGAHGKNHGHQKRKNTPKTKGNYVVFNRRLRDVEQREDQEQDRYVDRALRNSKAADLKRKNSDG